MKNEEEHKMVRKKSINLKRNKEIRDTYKKLKKDGKITYRELGKMFDLSGSTISDIVKGEKFIYEKRLKSQKYAKLPETIELRRNYAKKRYHESEKARANQIKASKKWAAKQFLKDQGYSKKQLKELGLA